MSKYIYDLPYFALFSSFSRLLHILSIIYVINNIKEELYAVWIIAISTVDIFRLFSLSGSTKAIIREGSKNLDGLSRFLEDVVSLRNLCSLFAIVLCSLYALFSQSEVMLKFYIITISITIILQSISQVYGSILFSSENLKLESNIQVFTKIVYSITLISLISYGLNINALVISLFLQQLLDIVLRYYYSRRILKFKFISPLRLNLNTLKEFFNISLLSYLGKLFSTVEIIHLSLLTDLKSVAIYAVAQRPIKQLTFLRNLISQALFPSAVKEFRHVSYSSHLSFVKGIAKFFLLSFPIVIIFYMFGQEVFSSIFGERYESSFNIFIILLISQIFFVSTLPFTIVFQALYFESLVNKIFLSVIVLKLILNTFSYSYFGLIGVSFVSLLINVLLLLLLNLAYFFKWKSHTA